MKLNLLIGAVLASVTAVSPNAEAASMDLTYWNGSLFGNADGLSSCTNTITHAIRHNSDDSSEDGRCWVTIPLPLKSGTVVQQVTVYYDAVPQQNGSSETVESAGELEIALGREDIALSETADRYTPIVFWAGGISDDISAGPMTMDLLTPQVAQPGYEHGFTVEETGSYGIGIGLRGFAGFYGVRITYAEAAAFRAVGVHR